jgi:hypothetical protein
MKSADFVTPLKLINSKVYKLCICYAKMGIILPGYEPVFENEVYGRDFSFPLRNGETVPMRRLVLLTRFTEPSEDQVVDFLQKKVASLNRGGLIVTPSGQQVSSTKSLLERVILALPPQVKQDIVGKDERCIGFIRSNIPCPALKPGEQPSSFLTIKYGQLTQELIAANKDNIKSARWYHAAFSDSDLSERGLGGRWKIQVTLPNGLLPRRDDAAQVLEDFKVSGMYSAKEGRGVLDALYEGLQSAEQISQLRDVSAEELERCAFTSVHALYQHLAACAEAARAEADSSGLAIPAAAVARGR